MFTRTRLFSRLGRRGLVLLLFGVAWLIQGASFFLLPGMGSGTNFWVDRLPVHLQGTMWLVAGVLSVVISIRRVPPHSDTAGFLAVSSMPMLLAVSYFVGAVTRILINDPMWVLGVLGFSIWGVITLALGVIASWPEVSDDGRLP